MSSYLWTIQYIDNNKVLICELTGQALLRCTGGVTMWNNFAIKSYPLLEFVITQSLILNRHADIHGHMALIRAKNRFEFSVEIYHL